MDRNAGAGVSLMVSTPNPPGATVPYYYRRGVPTRVMRLIVATGSVLSLLSILSTNAWSQTKPLPPQRLGAYT